MKTFASLIAASALALGVFAAPAFAADTYKIEPNHTAVVFQYVHGGGLSHMSGKFMNAVGSVTLDSDAPANSSVEVSFAIDGVNTGVPALDAHLKSPDFFDAAKFPTATFKSTSVTVTGADTADVLGNLTLHGVTKPVTLHVKLNKNSDDGRKAGFSATASILRSDFGVDKFTPMVSDQVDLYIETELVK
ncbi:MAG: YceI family protein [Asticcacaulis sp.]|nr:YceI family protein [Asticcacaulis sp.]